MSTETSGTTDEQNSALELTVTDVIGAIEDDPANAVTDPYLTAIATWEKGEPDKAIRFWDTASLGANFNRVQSAVSERVNELEKTDDETPGVVEPPELESPEGNVPTLADVLETVEAEFGIVSRRVAEVVLSTTATLTIEDSEDWPGLIIEGGSSSGKTTLLSSLLPSSMDLVEQVQRITSAAFISASSDREKSEVQKGSLYRQINGRTLLLPEMARIFHTGSSEKFDNLMGTLAGCMDGGEYGSWTGSQDKQSVEGSRAFLLGATTPIPMSRWRQMGNTGNRFLVAEFPTDTNPKAVKGTSKEADESKGRDRKRRVSDVSVPFIHDLWASNGGFEGVDATEFDVPDDVHKHIDYLTTVVMYGRAARSEDGARMVEGEHRVSRMLRNMTKGRALLDGRTTVKESDVWVASYAALSSIPYRRRGIMRGAIVRRGEPLKSTEAEHLSPYARQTTREVMRELANLGIGKYSESDDGHTLETYEAFWWPDNREFPDFTVGE